jgi:activating signal cointegrator complex subunit 1
MGKKKGKGEYNDFLEDTKLRDNADVRTTLQSSRPLIRTVSPHVSNTTTDTRAKAKNPRFTHFLSIPLISDTNRPHLTQALTHFQSAVQQHTRVPPTTIRFPGSLHLTLGIMSLSTSQLAEATAYLTSLDAAKLLRGITTQTIASVASDSTALGEGFGAISNPSHPDLPDPSTMDPDSLVVQLHGLHPMHKPEWTSVLYAEPRDATGRLQAFTESVRSGFEERGWMVPNQSEFRLHATILNTIYARRKGGGEGAAKKKGRGEGGAGTEEDATDGEVEKEAEKETGEKRQSHASSAKGPRRFDASKLVGLYEDFVWADNVRIDRVQICKLGAKKVWSGVEGESEVVDEQYKVVAEKRF